MPKNKDKIAVYSRKSRFTGKGESVDNQVEMCREYINTSFGVRYAQYIEVFEDEGFSGGNLNRPGFKKMMQAARRREFKAVVVYRLDRISRNISDFSALIEELRSLEIDFISIRESFDTSTPMGRAMMYIASVFSQLERETIAERIRDNMHELAKTGRWLGGTTPTGYESESVQSITMDGKSKKCCKLKLVPEEAELVKFIYRIYRQTDSLTMTEAELLRQCIKTKTGKDFTRFSIKAILQNPVYMIAEEEAYSYFVQKQADVCSTLKEFDSVRGMMVYNRTDQQKGKSTIYLPPCEWVVSVGQHTGIIPAKIWIEVQQSLEENKAKAYRKARKNEALLTGILWCSCGNRMYPKVSQRTDENGKRKYTYVCKMKEHSKRSLCDRKNANGNILDAAILEEIKKIPYQKYRFAAQLKKENVFYSMDQGREDEQQEKLQMEQRQIRKKISALVDALSNFDQSESVIHIKERLEMLHHRENELQQQIKEIEKEAQKQRLAPDEMRLLVSRFTTASTAIDSMTVEQKRRLIRSIVKKVVWNGKEAQVILWGSEETVENDLCEDSK